MKEEKKKDEIELKVIVKNPPVEESGDGPITIRNGPTQVDGRYRVTKKSIVPVQGVAWILRTFQKKHCLVYVPQKKDDSFCCCGRSKENHGLPITQSEIERNISIQWDREKHTRVEGTNAYGDIEFHGAGKKTRAKYIRLSDETRPVDTLKLLLREWKLDFPKLLISVTGGAKSFKLSPKLKQMFSEGLSKVAQSTGAWVITGGTNTGVMKHVGEALQGAQQKLESHLEPNKIVCIGISTWGIVNDRRKLTKTLETVNYHITNSLSSFGACLDNNHTHFLLVDHGVIDYGGEIAFRGKLERCIRELKYESRGIDGIPGVQLVLEGGPNTILTVHAAISQVPPMPVVVIKGSGRAADLLAFAVDMSYTNGPLFEMADVVEHSQLVDMIQKAFPEMNSEKCTSIYKNIIECMQYKENITIYAIDSEGDASIDEAILTAFLNAKKVRASNQLNLAMIWNRVDIARSKIFIEENKWTQSELEESMKNALSRNKPGFVELLLENGVSMSQFLTVERLEALYNYRATRVNSILNVLFEEKKWRNGGLISLNDVSVVLKYLIGVKIRPDHLIEKKFLKKIVLQNVADGRKYFDHPFHELFIWAVLSNMPEMAFTLWKHGDEALAKALVGKKIFQQLAKVADHSHMLEDIVEGLEQSANTFDDYAVKLLQECFQSNGVLTGQLVTYNLTNWGQETCLSLAVASNHLNFVAHSCCQDLLSTRWTGALQLHGMQAWKIFFCVIFPPFIFLLRFRTQKQISQMIMTEAEYRENLEFTYEREGTRGRRRGSSAGNKSKATCDSPNDRDELISNNFNNSVIIKGSTLTENLYDARSIFNDNPDDMMWHHKLAAFFKAPVTKFWSNVYAYILFLLLFGFVITTKLPDSPYNTEWLLVVMVFTLATEELRQIIQSDARGSFNKLKEWGYQYWNLCDAVAIILFFIGFALRMNKDTIVQGHVVYSLDIMLWIIRLLDIFTVHKQIGPYVVMIGKMTIDMAYFMFILLVFLVAYGVARYAILNPNEERSILTFGKILMVPYFQIYGELFVEYPNNNNNETMFSTVNHFDHIEPVVTVIMALYLLVANILLLNLLIAIFNNTYSIVQANSNVIWKFHRYHLVQEYSSRPVFVPPLIILLHIYDIIYTMIRWCCCSDNGKFKATDRKLKYFPNKDELHDLLLFEERCLTSFLRKQHTILFSTPDEKLRMISERVDNITSVVSESSKETIQSNRTHVASASTLEEKINNLERIVKVMTLNLSHIQLSLKQNGFINDEIAPEFRRKKGQRHQLPINLQRSISEYPHYLRNLSSKVAPPSPTSLPPMSHAFLAKKSSTTSDTGLFPNRVSAPTSDKGPFPNRVSRTTSDNGLVPNRASATNTDNGLYPNRAAARTSAVKRAAMQFRKGSIDSENILSVGSEETASFNDSGDEPIPRCNTFPTTRPLSMIKSGESLEIDENQSETSSATGLITSSPPPSITSTESSQFPTNKISIDITSDAKESLVYYDNEGMDEIDAKDIELMFEVHTLSRSSVYPLTNIHRYRLPDFLVPWEKSMPEYNPPEYTAQIVLAGPSWADVQVEGENNLVFNDLDGEVNRKSSAGLYEVVEGVPRNPNGRTGLKGRGLLGRYGPNHMSEAIMSRRSQNGMRIGSNFYDVIEVLTIGGKTLPYESKPEDDNLPSNLQKVFSKDTLLSLKINEQQCDKYMELLQDIIQNRVMVYDGYLDNERNTDNAWIETTVYSYHDATGDLFTKFLLSDKYSNMKLEWVEASFDMNLPDHQMEMIEHVLNMFEIEHDESKA